MIWNYKKPPFQVALFFGFELGFERSENLAFERSENEFFLILILYLTISALEIVSM